MRRTDGCTRGSVHCWLNPRLLNRLLLAGCELLLWPVLWRLRLWCWWALELRWWRLTDVRHWLLGVVQWRLLLLWLCALLGPSREGVLVVVLRSWRTRLVEGAQVHHFSPGGPFATPPTPL